MKESKPLHELVSNSPPHPLTHQMNRSHFVTAQILFNLLISLYQYIYVFCLCVQFTAPLPPPPPYNDIFRFTIAEGIFFLFTSRFLHFISFHFFVMASIFKCLKLCSHYSPPIPFTLSQFSSHYR